LDQTPLSLSQENEMKCRMCQDVDIPEGEDICDQCHTELLEEDEAINRAIDDHETYLSQTWSHYRITEFEDGSCLVECSTNDDNDDGYPDREVVRWNVHPKSLEVALELTGKSRVGCIGTVVTVWHNGIKI